MNFSRTRRPMNSASPELIASYLLALAGIPFPVKPILLKPARPAPVKRA